MKKKVICITLAAALMFGAMPAYAATDNAVRVVVDNKELTATGVIIDGRTLIPLRALGEALGATVNWDAAKQEIKIEKMLYQSDSSGNVTDSNRIIIMNIGKTQSLENGEAEQLDVAPQVINGSTMVPVKAVTDFLEATTTWDGTSRTVTVKSTLADSPQGAQWDQQHTAIGAAQATQDYMKKVNEDLEKEREQKEKEYIAENKPKGDLKAWGYYLYSFEVDKMMQMTETRAWPGWGLNFAIESGDTAETDTDEQMFKLTVVDNMKNDVYTTTFIYGDLEEIYRGTKNLQIPSQYLDEDKYDYKFTVVV